MKKLSFLFFIFSFFGQLLAQNLIKGTVKTEENVALDKVLIINLKTNQKIYTDVTGNFQILAQISDEIRLVKNGYDRQSYIVKQSDLEGFLSFKMKMTESIIEPVEIISKNRMDKLNRDLGVPNVKKGTPSRPKPAEWKNVLGSVLFLSPDLNAIQELITGDARRKKTLYKYEDLQSEINEAKYILGEEYFIEKGIPQERILEFLTFSIIEKPEIKRYIKKNNLMQIMMVLEQIMPIYLQRLNKNK